MVSDEVEQTVTNLCGGQGSGWCWCDEACEDWGDCCADYTESCVDDGPGSGSFCGGIAGIGCPAGETCIDDPSDNCDPQSGWSDCGGVCVPACDPTLVCTQVITCVDGQSYPTGCGPANCDQPMGPC